MIAVFVFQLVAPLLLIGWFAAWPARSAAGFAAQVTAIALALLALALTGLWLFPQWWAAYGFGILCLLAALCGVRRRWPFASVLPASAGAWVVTLSCLVLGGATGQRAALAWVGRMPSAGQLVDLRFPLAGGSYLVVNGGNDGVVNAHLKTLDATVPRFQAWRGQSYAVDIVSIDALGLRADGLEPADPPHIASTASRSSHPARAASWPPSTGCPTCAFRKPTVRTWRAIM